VQHAGKLLHANSDYIAIEKSVTFIFDTQSHILEILSKRQQTSDMPKALVKKTIVLHGMARHGMAWHGISWHGISWHGISWHGIA
jgi:hypothetical protein